MSDEIQGADVHMANELMLCIVNEYKILHQLDYVTGSLAKKVKRGHYDPVLAGRAWRYTVEGYLPTYKREQGDVGRVSVATRNLAGRFLEEHQREAVYAAAGVAEPAFPQDADLRAFEAGEQ